MFFYFDFISTGFLLKESQPGPAPLLSLIARYPQNPGINMPQPGGRGPGIPPIGIPLIHRIPPSTYETPTNSSKNKVLEDPLSIFNKIIQEDPTNSVNQIEKQAARLIVIRRRKMNVHKLKKLRKKMKYIWAKVKLRREIRVEKAFLNSKMAQIREAQKFDAKAYVADIIRKATEVPFPKKWRGQPLPEHLIRENMEKEAKQKQQEYLSILNKRFIKQE